MSDQTENQAEQQPVFRMQKMYIKDLSFESPHAPKVFLARIRIPRLILT